MAASSADPRFSSLRAGTPNRALERSDRRPKIGEMSSHARRKVKGEWRLLAYVLLAGCSAVATLAISGPRAAVIILPGLLGGLLVADGGRRRRRSSDHSRVHGRQTESRNRSSLWGDHPVPLEVPHHVEGSAGSDPETPNHAVRGPPPRPIDEAGGLGFNSNTATNGRSGGAAHLGLPFVGANAAVFRGLARTICARNAGVRE